MVSAGYLASSLESCEIPGMLGALVIVFGYDRKALGRFGIGSFELKYVRIKQLLRYLSLTALSDRFQV